MHERDILVAHCLDSKQRPLMRARIPYIWRSRKLSEVIADGFDSTGDYLAAFES